MASVDICQYRLMETGEDATFDVLDLRESPDNGKFTDTISGPQADRFFKILQSANPWSSTEFHALSSLLWQEARTEKGIPDVRKLARCTEEISEVLDSSRALLVMCLKAQLTEDLRYEDLVEFSCTVFRGTVHGTLFVVDTSGSGQNSLRFVSRHKEQLRVFSPGKVFPEGKAFPDLLIGSEAPTLPNETEAE